jgi:hypothetical protein
MNTTTYLGKKPLTADHEPALPGVGDRICGASFRGAIGDCTRTKGHPLEGPEGFHQGAHGYAWTETPEEAPAPVAYRRRTSAYTLRVAAEPGDLRGQLDAALAALPADAGVIDQHYATEEGGAYVSVTWRSSSPEEAAAVSAEVLEKLGRPEAYLTTGLGVHRRVVEHFPARAEEALAETTARVTGSRAATVRVERRNEDGTLSVEAEGAWGRRGTVEDRMAKFVEEHRARGHDATFTVAGAPGTGRGTWCSTCKTYGPNNIRVLSPEETR